MKDAKEMSCPEIFMAIRDRQITALMFHSQMADLFDFLGLRGFKRMHEYQYLSESMDNRGLDRYYLNHHNKLLVGGHPRGVEVIPAEWGQYTRFDVTPQVRKQAVEKFLSRYRTWEVETKDLLSIYCKSLMDMGNVADFNKVNSLLEKVDQELKVLDRLILSLDSVSYDEVYMVSIQDSIHSTYQKKTLELGVDIC